MDFLYKTINVLIIAATLILVSGCENLGVQSDESSAALTFKGLSNITYSDSTESYTLYWRPASASDEELSYQYKIYQVEYTDDSAASFGVALDDVNLRKARLGEFPSDRTPAKLGELVGSASSTESAFQVSFPVSSKSSYAFQVISESLEGIVDTNTTVILLVAKDLSQEESFTGCSNVAAKSTTTINVTYQDLPEGYDSIRILRDGVTIYEKDTSSGGTITDKDLTEGQSYTYSCYAISNSGDKLLGSNEPTETTVAVNTPTFDGIVSAGEVSSRAVLLSWAVGSGVPVGSYKVFRTQGNSVDWTSTPVKTITDGSTSVTLSDQGDELTYSYGVRACNSSDICESNTAEESVTLSNVSAPLTSGASDVTISNGSLIVSIPWDHTDGRVYKRHIYQRTGATGGTNIANYTLIQTVLVSDPTAPSTTYTIASPSENTTYHFIVRDEDTYANVTTNTNVVTITTGDLTAPFFSGITALTNGGAGLEETVLLASFTAIAKEVDDAANGASHYMVYSKINGGDACASGTLVEEIAVDSYTATTSYQISVTGLTARTNYSICLKARDSAGNISSTTAYLTDNTLDTTAPDFDGLQSISYNTGTGKIDLTWNQSPSADVDSYKIKVWKNTATPSGGDITTLGLKSDATYPSGYSMSTSDFSFSSLDLVYVTVDACDDAASVSGSSQNCNAYTASDSKNVSLPDVEAPPGFVGIKAAGSLLTPAEGQVTVAWYTPADWSDYRGFKVYYVDNSDDSVTIAKDCACADYGCSDQITSCVVTGLDARRTYTFNVQAYDAEGNITALDVSSSKSSKQTTDTTAPAFAGLSSGAYDSGDSDIDLTWATATDNQYASEGGATLTYKLYRSAGSDFADPTDPAADGQLLTTTTSTSYSDSNSLTSTTTYYYGVCVLDASSNTTCTTSSTSVAVPDLTPPVISGITTTHSDYETKSWTLSWTMSDNATASGDLVVKIYRSESASAETASASDSLADSVVGATTSSTLTGPTDTNTYLNYFIEVEDEDGNKASTTLSLYSENLIGYTRIRTTEGITAGGDLIVITGNNFYSGTSVTIGGSSCTSLTIHSKTHLSCLSPSNGGTGTADVVISNADGSSSTQAGAFTYCTQDSCTNICNNPASWGGTFADGDGTNLSPYGICNIDHLNAIRTQGDSKYYTLDANIDMVGETGNSFAPLTNTGGGEFNGIFYGQYHSILNYTYKVAGEDYVGFFAKSQNSSSTIINNINIINVDVEGNTNVGGLIGRLYTGGSASNIYVSGDVTGNGQYNGGIFGNLSTTTSGYLISDTNITNLSNGYSGGIIGTVSSSGSLDGTTLEWRGAITAANHFHGGIAGSFNPSNPDVITSVYVKGTITGGAYYVGGFTGYSSKSFTISTADIDITMTGGDRRGGVIGQQGSTAAQLTLDDATITTTLSTCATGDISIGGIIGEVIHRSLENTITNTDIIMNTPSDSDCDNVGGIVGDNFADLTVSNVTVSGDIYGRTYVAGGVGYLEPDTTPPVITMNNVTMSANITGSNVVAGLTGAANSTTTTSYSILNLSNITVSGDITATNGAAAGLAYAATLMSGGLIDNITVSGNMTASGGVGGLIISLREVGTDENTTDISNITISGNLTSTSTSGTQNASGIIGKYDTQDGSGKTLVIEDVVVSGDISYGQGYTGGIMALNLDGGSVITDVIIRRAAVTGDITCGTSCGGIIGANGSGTDDVTIEDSYFSGSISSTSSNVGGIIGLCYATGLVVDNVYVSGSVAGASNTKAIKGYGSGTITASNCFFDNETTGHTSDSNCTAKSTALMQTEATFTGAGWDYGTVWQTPAGGGYPEFQ